MTKTVDLKKYNDDLLYKRILQRGNDSEEVRALKSDVEAYKRSEYTLQSSIKLLQAQLSSKSQECEELKQEVWKQKDMVTAREEEVHRICKQSNADIEVLRAENERLKTTLVAGAELIKENWNKLCDEEGYGPQNLLLRMEGTLNTSGYPGYSAGEFEKLRKRCEDLEADQIILKSKVKQIEQECFDWRIKYENCKPLSQ